MKYKYCRQQTHPVRVGGVVIGGDGGIVLQSMTTTSTRDTALSCAQVLRIAEAGGEIVRLTAQGRGEAENLANIKACLRDRGCLVPLVADIHFNSSLALIAARLVEKVRINPGNFVDKRADFQSVDYSDEQWAGEVLQLGDRLRELLVVCRAHGTALRIGVNHGSLSDRIMSRYGNTARGMVASAMEFLEVCVADGFGDVVVSLKSSNVGVMIQGYRLLSDAMLERGMDFPLHLGVTEAGQGMQGRVRSGVGIGTLLGEGLGDTIRVSLTEPPENEVPAARALVEYMVGDERWVGPEILCEELVSGGRRYDYSALVPLVVGGGGGDLRPEQCALWPRYTVDQVIGGEVLPSDTPVVISSPYLGADWGQSIRYAMYMLDKQGVAAQRVIYKKYSSDLSSEKLQIHAAADFGGLFVDRLIGGMWIETFADDFGRGAEQCLSGEVAQGAATISEQGVAENPADELCAISLEIMQAARARISSAEIISCPGCGRTLYDLQSTVQQVKARFSGHKGLKLAVMGCIVNGPGEMADAEFGYVGSGAGLVTLYRAGQVVERNIPQHQALDKLEELIKAWAPIRGGALAADGVCESLSPGPLFGGA